MTIDNVSPACDEACSLMYELDAEISALYPGSPIHGIDVPKFEQAGGYFVIARQAAKAIGCGGFWPIDSECAEIKRMFVRTDCRRRGIARQILRHLELEVYRRGFRSIVLETGCNNSGARALYESEGYALISSYRGCVGIAAISRCYYKGSRPQP